MNKNKSHLTIIMDRSGSMSTIARDMEGGLNQLIEEQKKQLGECTVSFYKFDNEIERDLYFSNIQSVGELKLEPRGMTALNDAIAKAVIETGEYLSNLQEKDRPALVTVVIVTDGGENSSVEYKDPNVIKKMIDEQTTKYSWHFNYLGANQDSFAVAAQYGVQNVSNYSLGKAESVMKNFSGKMSAARSATSYGMSVNSLSYTKEDMDELN